MRHGEDAIAMMAVSTLLEAAKKMGRELELCPDCFYLTLVANLLYDLMTKADYSEEEVMTEVQNIVTSFRDDSTEGRVYH